MVFENVLSLVAPQKEIKKSWFVDWIYGNDLKVNWNKSNGAGVGTFAMVQNAHNEGFSVVTGAVANDNSSINFNQIRHYDPRAVVVETISRILRTTDAISANGLFFGINNDTIDSEWYGFDSALHTNFQLFSDLGGGGTYTDTGIVLDTNFHRFKMEGQLTVTLLSVDGILRASKTDELPILKMNPQLLSVSRITTPFEQRYRYFEVFNT